MIELQAGGATSPARASIDPRAGGRVASLVVNGLELFVTSADDPDDMRHGCYPMVPWAGRVRSGRFEFGGTTYQLPVNLPPHAIHGTGFTRAWTVEEADSTRVRLRTDLGPAWPFGGWCEQAMTLHPDRLDLRLEVHTSDAMMPAACGWHPWWRRRLARSDPPIQSRAGSSDGVQLELAARWMYVRDAEGMPTGELVAPSAPPWDDCFTGLATAPRLRWPGALSVTIESSCDHVVVYDEPRHAVCVEPQTGPPDALNLGPTIVEPHRPLIAETSFRWR